MSDSHQEYIKKIRSDFQASQRVKDSLNNSIQALARDLYNKDTHFVLELLQNAEDNTYDCADPSLVFQLSRTDPTGTQGSTGALIVQNNEIGFSENNVNAICSVGNTTKSKIQGYIGEKGIGFKSVFRITSNPHIFSNGYRFCMPESDEETGLGFIVPRWINIIPDGIDPSQTTILLPLDKDIFGAESIGSMLREIEPETILFLSKLKEIRILSDAGDSLTIIKDDSKAPLVQILVDGTKAGGVISDVYEYLVITKLFALPKDLHEEKRVGVCDRPVTIAFPLDKGKENLGKVFAYLPVYSDTGLPFSVNADFILTSSREAIHETLPWNRWLVSCVAALMKEALQGLKEERQLTVDFLEKLAKGILALDDGDFLYPIVGALREAFLNGEFLPAADRSFVSARNAKLARGADLTTLLKPDILRSLFQSTSVLKWLQIDITQIRTPNLHRYLLSEPKVEEVTPDIFARKITPLFLASQLDDWYVDFYKYLTGQEALWRPPRWPGDNNFGVLRNKTILRLEDLSQVAPFDVNGNPNAYLPPEHDTSLPIMRRQIANKQVAAEFLNRLGLSMPDEVADVINNILRRYRDNEGALIGKDIYEADLKAISRAMKTDSEQKKGHLISEAQKTRFIRSRNAATGEVDYKKPTEVYLPTEQMTVYWKSNPAGWLADDLVYHELMDCVDQLGIVATVRVFCRKAQYLGGPVHLHDWHGSHSRGKGGFDPEAQIDGIEFAVSNPNPARSEFIWNNVCIPNKHLLKGIVESSSRQDYSGSMRIEKTSTVGKFVVENAWLCGRDGSTHLPSDISLEDLPDDYERDAELARILGMNISLNQERDDRLKTLSEVIGFRTEYLEIAKNNPEEFAKWCEETRARPSKPSPFPEKPLNDPERRREQIIKQLLEAPVKEYEERDRNVRVTRGNVDPVISLKEWYTNTDGELKCQICKKKMPFKKRNGEYYFEAVEALSRDYFPKEHEAQFLALCPLCAAMYREFIKLDVDKMKLIKQALLNADEPELPLELGELHSSVRFVESHFHDIQTILQEHES